MIYQCRICKEDDLSLSEIVECLDQMDEHICVECCMDKQDDQKIWDRFCVDCENNKFKRGQYAGNHT